MLTTTQESSEKWLWYKNEETKTQTEEVNCLNQNQESPARLQCLSSVLLCPKTLMTQHVWQNLGSPVLCRLTSLVAPYLLRWYMNMEVWGLQPGRFHEDIQEPFQKPLSQKCRTFRMLWLNTAFCHQMATWFNLSHSVTGWGRSHGEGNGYRLQHLRNFPGDSDSEESACIEGGLRLIPGSERHSREGNGSPLQYSCLENSMDRGDWWETVHEVTKSQTQLNN